MTKISGFSPTVQNSPEAKTTAYISSSATTIPVDYCEYFIADGWAYTDVSASYPVLAVIDPDNASFAYPETVRITAISAASGAGNLTVVRAIGATATIGIAREFASGTKISCVATRQHIEELQDGLQDIDASQITGIVTPNAGFTWVEDDSVVSNTVNFTDASTTGTLPITAWYWDFGDGTYSSTQSPSHTYSGFGIYQVSLTATNAAGTGSITKSITVVSAPIYGYRIIDAESSPTAKVEYIEASVGFDPVTLDPSTGAIDYGDWETIVNATFTPSVLLANAAGYTDLDRTNLALYADGTTPSPLDLVSGTVTDGDVCCRISHLIYEQITRVGLNEEHRFCSKQPDPSYVARAHTFGDEVRANRFLGMFEGIVISTVMYSRYTIDTFPTASTKQDTYRSYTTEAKKGAATYGLKSMHTDDLHTSLSVLFLKTLNFQGAVGNGNSTSAAYLKTGEGLNLTGGPLQGDTTATNKGVMIFWVWNKYGNYWEDVDGFVMIEDGKHWVNRTNKDFLNIGSLPTECPENYDEVLLPTPTNGYIRRMSGDPRAPLIPIATGFGADSSHHYPDYFYKVVGVRKLMRGGARTIGEACGPFNANVNFAPGDADGSFIARVQGFLASE